MNNRKKQMLEQSREQPSRRIRVGFTMVNPKGLPVPAAKPSDIIQLSPIVQPIAMTPYSTQQQHLTSDVDENF